MTDKPIRTPSGKVPGRGAYKGLYRSDPAALTAESGDVLPPISTSLADLLGGIDGTDHGRRRGYNLSDEPLELMPGCMVYLGPTTADDDAQADDAQADDAEARAEVLAADSDEADGLDVEELEL